MNANSPKCETCRFWARNYFGSGWQRSGQCRKYAPQAGKHTPETYEDHWCGEHEAKP
jgi:hypothetical protein